MGVATKFTTGLKCTKLFSAASEYNGNLHRISWLT